MQSKETLINPFKNNDHKDYSNNFYNKIPTCPICLGFLIKPVKSTQCQHIFCEVCFNMWLQKRSNCPICRKSVDKVISLYFPNVVHNNNNKLNYLYNSIENLKLDNYGHFSRLCLVCGKEEPTEQLICCDLCNYFQSHILCDPSPGIALGKFYCLFCRKKFIDSLKNK